MRKLLLLSSLILFISFLVSGFLYAQNAPICVTVVFYDRNQTPPDDLVKVSVRPNAIPSLDLERGRPVLTIHVVRGPIGSRNTVVITGHEAFGISLLGTEDVYVGQFDKGKVLDDQDRGRVFSLKKDGSAVLTTLPDEFAETAIMDQDVVLVSLIFTDPSYDDAQLRSISLTLAEKDACV